MSNVTVDDTQVRNLFQALEPEANKEVLLKALKKGAQILVDSTRNQLRLKMGGAATTPNRWNGKTMEDGIRLKADKAYTEVAVNIMGDFRLKFFEKGTKQRITKSKANRGSIKPIHFFKIARQDNSDVIDAIDQSLQESFRNIGK